MTHPSVSPGASFRVDMERAPQAIADLKSALHELEDIKRDALKLGTVQPGSKDSVSVEAARLIGAAAVGAPGALVPALDAGMQQIRELVTTMESELNAYRGVDHEAAGWLRAAGRGQNRP